jgi:hypothetical protein
VIAPEYLALANERMLRRVTVTCRSRKGRVARPAASIGERKPGKRADREKRQDIAGHGFTLHWSCHENLAEERSLHKLRKAQEGSRLCHVRWPHDHEKRALRRARLAPNPSTVSEGHWKPCSRIY